MLCAVLYLYCFVPSDGSPAQGRAVRAEARLRARQHLAAQAPGDAAQVRAGECTHCTHTRMSRKYKYSLTNKRSNKYTLKRTVTYTNIPVFFWKIQIHIDLTKQAYKILKTNSHTNKSTHPNNLLPNGIGSQSEILCNNSRIQFLIHTNKNSLTSKTKNPTYKRIEFVLSILDMNADR